MHAGAHAVCICAWLQSGLSFLGSASSLLWRVFDYGAWKLVDIAGLIHHRSVAVAVHILPSSPLWGFGRQWVLGPSCASQVTFASLLLLVLAGHIIWWLGTVVIVCLSVHVHYASGDVQLGRALLFPHASLLREIAGYAGRDCMLQCGVHV